jgi:hypothetical protein
MAQCAPRHELNADSLEGEHYALELERSAREEGAGCNQFRPIAGTVQRNVDRLSLPGNLQFA